MSTDQSSMESFRESHLESSKLYIEVELHSGSISWVNHTLAEKCKVENKAILDSNIYGLVDEAFRGKLATMISSFEPSEFPRKTLWPISCAADKISWWMAELELWDEHKIIYSVVPMVTMDRTEIGYKLITLSADNTYLASSSLIEINKIKNEVIELRKLLNDEITKTKNYISDAIDAAKKAEEAALTNKKLIEELNQQVKDQFDEHTQEIKKLITSDVVHDSRMTIFENHVKKTTSEAVVKIIDQADKSGKGLTKRIVLPVGFMATVIAFLQWLITRYFH